MYSPIEFHDNREMQLEVNLYLDKMIFLLGTLLNLLFSVDCALHDMSS